MPECGVVGEVAVVPSFPGLIIGFEIVGKFAGMQVAVLIPLYFLTVSLQFNGVFSWFLGHR